MTWKNWGDHPIVVSVGICLALFGLGYTIYDHHFKSDTPAPTSPLQPISAPSPSTDAHSLFQKTNPSPETQPTLSKLSHTPSTDPPIIEGKEVQFISFSDPEDSRFLRKNFFKWEPGLLRNSYTVSDGILKIMAAAGTDAFPNTEPRVVLPAHDDFEVTVKVRFNSNTNYQRATLGVRDIGGSSGIMRLYKLEKQRIEAGFYPENNNKIPNNITMYPSNSVYLRIKKQGTSLSALYSSDKKNWSSILERQMAQNLREVEVFLSVLSTDKNESIDAEFSELAMRQL